MGPRHTSSRRLMAGGERSVGSIMSIDPADLWVAADEDFQEWVLERAYADNPAQCPLSADEDDPTCSLIHFAQGSLEVVHDDLRRVLPPAQLKEAIDILRVVGIDDAFVVRRELVNYKKTCLNIQRCATQLDRDLRQLVTFFKGSDDERIDIDDERIYVHSDRHTALCDALGQCKGALGVMSDLRQFVKTVCCVSRHPAKATPEYLAGLPRSLKHLRKYVRCAGDTVASQRGHTTVDEVHEADGDDDGADLHRGEESGAAHLARAMDGFAHLGWPPRIVSFVRKSLVAKGAVKALWMHSELIRGLRHLETYLRLLRGCVTELEAAPNLVDALSASRLEGVHGGDASSILQRVSRACRVRKELNQLYGAMEALGDQTTWLRRIADVPAERLFVAGDSDLRASTSMFIPSGFRVGDLFARQRAVCDGEFPRMMDVLRHEGWPTHLLGRLGAEKRTETNFKETTCRVCARGFSSLWVHRFICVACEINERFELGRCPYRESCASPFCPHANRCFVCDSWSCGECRLIRGDGEECLALAQQIEPDLTYLDWDRTVCTTRSGASPLKGTHAVDPDLLSMICSRPKGSVHIVTRNSYRDDIKTFMARAGLPDDIPVHTVKKHQSKAEVILEGNEGTILFVDDSVAEHMDERLMRSGVFRVLFGRALS